MAYHWQGLTMVARFGRRRGGGGLFCSVGSGGPSTGWQRGAAGQMQLGEGRLMLVDACLCGLRSR